MQETGTYFYMQITETFGIFRKENVLKEKLFELCVYIIVHCVQYVVSEVCADVTSVQMCQFEIRFNY